MRELDFGNWVFDPADFAEHSAGIGYLKPVASAFKGQIVRIVQLLLPLSSPAQPPRANDHHHHTGAEGATRRVPGILRLPLKEPVVRDPDEERHADKDRQPSE
jgi:hypothetical protein